MSARQAAQQNIQKQAEATNKNNETISEACEDLQAFQAKPEEGEVAELANSLAKAVQLQAGSPLGKQMSAQDQRALQEIRSFSASCAGSDSDANILRPSDVKNGMVTVESFCDNQDARELYKDLGAEELCSKGPEDTCSKKDFLAQLKNVKDKLCLNKDTGELYLSKGLGCPENSKVSESILTNPDNYETVKEVANIKNLCKVQSRDIASIEDKLKPMVNGYNCHIASKKAGQLGVSVCNADMAQTGLNGKGILQQASSDIFRAYGASRSLEN